jgi:hypothetical protein
MPRHMKLPPPVACDPRGCASRTRMRSRSSLALPCHVKSFLLVFGVSQHCLCMLRQHPSTFSIHPSSTGHRSINTKAGASGVWLPWPDQAWKHLRRPLRLPEGL